MLFNRKVDYGLRVLLYLSKYKDRGLISSLKLSQKLEISRDFISKILQILGRKNIIESRRGKGGGVSLKNPGVPVLEIIKNLDPGFSLNKCLSSRFSCSFKNRCPLRRLLREIENDLNQKLAGIKLSELAK